MTAAADGFALDPQLVRDTFAVGDFRLSKLRLMNDSNYPWFILVPQRRGLRELFELGAADAAQFWDESAALGRALMSVFKGEKLNVAALGNVVAQLHVHHIVRFRDDPAWPAPVWGRVAVRPYSPTERDRRIEAVTRELRRRTGHSFAMDA